MLSMPTKEEMEAIRDFVLLPVMLTIVEKNRQQIERSPYPMRPLYAAATEALARRIHEDLVRARKTLKEAGIKIWEEQRSQYVIYYRFVCRGYQETFAIIREVARAEIHMKLKMYIDQMFEPKTD